MPQIEYAANGRQLIETAAQRRLEHYRLYERNWVPSNISPHSVNSLTGNVEETKGGHLYPSPKVFPGPDIFPR